ncbi:MAG: hypothetical protein ABL952_04745 [Pyrinomonadaceae bacterium]
MLDDADGDALFLRLRLDDAERFLDGLAGVKRDELGGRRSRVVKKVRYLLVDAGDLGL